MDLFVGQVKQAHQSKPIRQVAIPVQLAHSTIGAAPSVAVSSATLGFDWDNGTLFINPVQPLTPLTPEDLASIQLARKEGQSYAMQKAHERWNSEKGGLVDTINKLRTALLQSGMSSSDLEDLAGPAPTMRVRRGK